MGPLGDVSGRLSGKIAVVSGAGQTPGETIGNGRAIARLFAMAGATIVCVDRQLDRATAVADEICAAETGEAGTGARSGTAIAVAADVTDSDDVDRVVATTLDEFGGIDVVINNVGIGGGGDGRLDRLDEAAFDRIWNVNLKTAWLLTKAAWPAMVERGGGSVVNISSLASIAGASQMAYETSKAAMNRMTQTGALNGARHGIRCNAIAPGLMDTPMAIEGIAAATGRPTDEVRAQRAAAVPMRHMGTAWDTAHAALYLASDEARFVSGVVLRVDGAQGARVG